MQGATGAHLQISVEDPQGLWYLKLPRGDEEVYLLKHYQSTTDNILSPEVRKEYAPRILPPGEAVVARGETRKDKPDTAYQETCRISPGPPRAARPADPCEVDTFPSSLVCSLA